MLDYKFFHRDHKQVKYPNVHFNCLGCKEEDMQRQEKNKGLKNIHVTGQIFDFTLVLT